MKSSKMSNASCSTPATPEEDKALFPIKHSFGHYCQMDKPNLIEAHKRKKGAHRGWKPSEQPRWYNQSYLLFLALRQHPQKSMARTELIKAAVALDKKISEERLLPRVFRGKTPMNSASAVLSNNHDRYFVAFKPEGSKSMHFKLSFEPGNFDVAFAEYNDWQEQLTKTDWPLFFASKRESQSSSPTSPKVIKETVLLVPTTSETAVRELEVARPVTRLYPTEFDEFMANRKKAREQLFQQSPQHQQPLLKHKLQNAQSGIPKLQTQQQSAPKQSFPVTVPPLTPTAEHDYTTLEDSLPKTLKDIIYLTKDGLFAKQKLPKNTPLGFYFGVPMSEDEFDGLKDGIGQASEKCVLYKKTVIDPTDDQGKLYDLQNQPLCPFHHLGATSDRDMANIILYEGHSVNQIVCWTKKDIGKAEELLVYHYPNHQQPQQLHSPPLSDSVLKQVDTCQTKELTYSKKHEEIGKDKLVCEQQQHQHKQPSYYGHRLSHLLLPPHQERPRSLSLQQQSPLFAEQSSRTLPPLDPSLYRNSSLLQQSSRLPSIPISNTTHSSE